MVHRQRRLKGGQWWWLLLVVGGWGLVVGGWRLAAAQSQERTEGPGGGVDNEVLPLEEVEEVEGDAMIYLPSISYQYEPLGDANCRYGVASTGSGQLPWLNDLGVGWLITFGSYDVPRPANVEFVPVLSVRQDKDAAGNYLPTYTITPTLTNEGLGALVDGNPGRLWIVGNEVDRGPNPGETIRIQGDTFPEVYAQAYHDTYHFIKGRDASAKVANSALVQVTPGRLQYLDLMWDAYVAQFGSSMPVDVWNMHLYVLPEVTPSGQPNGIANVALGTDPAIAKRESGGDPGQCPLGTVYCWAEHDDLDIFAEQIVAMRAWMKAHGQQHKPLILSEYSILYPFLDYDDPENPTTCFLMDEYGGCFTAERVKTFLEETFAYLETATDVTLGYPADGGRLVQQWLWFALYTEAAGSVSNLVTSDLAQLTEVGQAFHDEVAARPLAVNLTPANLSFPIAFTNTVTNTVSVSLSAGVLNNGNEAEERSFVVTYYSDEALTQVLGSATVQGVAGCARQVETTTAVWLDLTPGLHRYWVQVDSGGAIGESNESDNVGSGYVLVNPEQAYLPMVQWR